MDPLRLELFKIAFQSDPMAVRGVLADMIAGLKDLPLDSDDLGTVELVLAEALNNVVEHAYPEGEPSGMVDIACTHSDAGLHFRVVDQGRPMPGGVVPPGKKANIDVDMYDLPEGGFGWFLIHDLVNDVQYFRENGRNVLDLRMTVPLNPQ